MADTPPTPRPRGRARKTADAEPGPKPSNPTGATDTTDTRGNGGNGGGAPGPTPRAASTPRPRSNSLEAKLGEFFGSFSLVFAATGDQYCAEIIAARAPALASSWAELAKQNASVRRVLESLMEGSAWGAVILSTLGVAVPIAKHHGLYNGPDPFSAILPGPPAPPVNGGTNGNGGARMSTWGARATNGDTPQRVIIPDPPMPYRDVPNPPTPAPIYQEGSPPGVVTVAAGSAQHTGARS